jgi:hypothetical protein
MLKITFIIERRKPSPQQPGQGLRRDGQQVHPLLVLVTVAYCATLITSLATGDNSLLIDFSRGLVQLASRLIGVELGT